MIKSEKFNKKISAIIAATLIVGSAPQVVRADTNNIDPRTLSVEDTALNVESKWINVTTLPKIESAELGRFWEDYDKYRINFPGTTNSEFDKFKKYIKAINETNDVTVNGIKYDNTNLVSEKDTYKMGALGLELNPSGFTKEINTIIVKANGYNDMEILVNKDGTFISEKEINSNESLVDTSSVVKNILPEVEKVEFDTFYSNFMKCRISFDSVTDANWKSVTDFRQAINFKSTVTVNGVNYTNSSDVENVNTFYFGLTGFELNQNAFKDGVNTVVIKADGYDTMTIKIKKDGQTMSIADSSTEAVDNSNSKSSTISDDIKETNKDEQNWQAVSLLPKVTTARYGEIYGRVEYEISFEQNDILNEYIKAADPQNPNTKPSELTVNGVRYYDNFSFGINEYHLSYMGGLELNDTSFTEDINTIILKVDGYNDMRIRVKKDGTLISQEEAPSLTATTETLRIYNIKEDASTLVGEPIDLMDNVSAFSIGKETIDLSNQIKIDTGDLDTQNPKEGTYEVTYSVTHNGQTKTQKRRVIVSNAIIPTDNLEDGVYTIGFKAYRADIPENESMLNGFFDEKIKVTVKDGKINLTMLNTLYGYSILDFCIESDGEYVSSKRQFVGEKNSIGEYDMQLCEVPISDLTSDHMGCVLVGMMGGKPSDIGNYAEYKEVRFVFDKNCSKGWKGFTTKIDLDETPDIKPNENPDVISDVTPAVASDTTADVNTDVKTDAKANTTTEVSSKTDSTTKPEVKANNTPNQNKPSQKDIKQKTLPNTGSSFNGNFLSMIGAMLASLGVFFFKNKRY